MPFYQTGKMDTSDLSERYFDENTVLYSASNRNSIVFDEGKEKKQESKDASSEAKTNEENTESSKEEGERDKETPSAPTDLDSGAEALIKKWQEFKAQNPEGTLNEFYSTLANMNQEG